MVALVRSKLELGFDGAACHLDARHWEDGCRECDWQCQGFERGSEMMRGYHSW